MKGWLVELEPVPARDFKITLCRISSEPGGNLSDISVLFKVGRYLKISLTAVTRPVQPAKSGHHVIRLANAPAFTSGVHLHPSILSSTHHFLVSNIPFGAFSKHSSIFNLPVFAISTSSAQITSLALGIESGPTSERKLISLQR
jgi:hypothetical protein